MNEFNKTIVLSIFNCGIVVRVFDKELYTVLMQVYGAMATVDSPASIHLSYIIKRNISSAKINIIRDDDIEYSTTDLSEFIFIFEKDMTIELQKIRADLLFIHSAVMEYKGQGLLLVAPSGTGKSTTSWAMLNSGFNYLSDELAPLSIDTMLVEAYPHALCLKSEPPMFELPEQCLYTSATIHVPVKNMPATAHKEALKLSYIFYLEFDGALSEPVIQEITTAQASAQLFSNSLNILAHDIGDSGLHAAVKVAKQVNNYTLRSNHLDKTCSAVKMLIDS